VDGRSPGLAPSPRWVVGVLADQQVAALLVSELVANVIKHAKVTELEVRVRVHEWGIAAEPGGGKCVWFGLEVAGPS
jgi:hypothetical protein